MLGPVTTDGLGGRFVSCAPHIHRWCNEVLPTVIILRWDFRA